MGFRNQNYPELISLAEAEELCDLTHAHLRRLAEQGKLDARKIGRNWVTTINAIEKYVSERKSPGRPKKRLD